MKRSMKYKPKEQDGVQHQSLQIRLIQAVIWCWMHRVVQASPTWQQTWAQSGVMLNKVADVLNIINADTSWAEHVGARARVARATIMTVFVRQRPEDREPKEAVMAQLVL